jgi:lipid-binding SYLF domain-containing protein
MKKLAPVILLASLTIFAFPALADRYSDTIALFKNAGESSNFLSSSYGYAAFPTIGKGGLGIGGAHGKGHVYQAGNYVGDTSMTQVSVGLQAGGEEYSEIIFFQNQEAFDKFTSGRFALSANASAIAITAGASASASTEGSGAGASGGKKDAKTAGGYQDGVAVFTIAKGGLMYEASVAGQKFSYKALTARAL